MSMSSRNAMISVSDLSDADIRRLVEVLQITNPKAIAGGLALMQASEGFQVEEENFLNPNTEKPGTRRRWPAQGKAPPRPEVAHPALACATQDLACGDDLQRVHFEDRNHSGEEAVEDDHELEVAFDEGEINIPAGCQFLSCGPGRWNLI